MIKHIYVIGDSFSFGQELGGSDVPMKDFFTFTPYMREKSYTGLIAKEWGVTGYTNVSQPGGSNDRIHRMLTLDIPVLLQQYKPEEIFVFVSMTHASRREFYDRLHQVYTPQISNFAPPKDNIPVYKLWEYYTAYFDHPFEQAQRHIVQTLSIQSLLKVFKIDYLITNSMNDNPEFIEEYNNLPLDVRKQIDRRHYPTTPFNVFAGNLKVPFGKHHHPLEEGHEAWAKYLMGYMKDFSIGQI